MRKWLPTAGKRIVIAGAAALAVGVLSAQPTASPNLKLEPRTGPVDVLVIDQVERPSEN